MAAEDSPKIIGLIQKDNQQFYNLQEDLLRRESYAQFQHVQDNLYIGSQISSLNLVKLEEYGIKHVLRVNGITQNIMPYDKHGIRFKVMDMDDMPDFNIEAHFDEAHEFITKGLESNQGVLVVCTAGISRSAAVVISYLIKKHKMPYSLALQKTKEARMFVQPNVGFERQLKEYSKLHACELCDMEKKTFWFEQYAKKKWNGKQLFRVLICDSCECPMIVYIASHKQELSQEELVEAFNLCEDVGNDYFGVGHWFIEGKQRKIHDHFHWHVRELKMVNDILAIRLLGEDPQVGEALTSMVQSLDLVKSKSFEMVSQHAGTSNFHVIEKRIQRGLVIPNNGQLIRIDSKVRFDFDGIKAIEQTVYLLPAQSKGRKITQASMIQYILAQVYYRIVINKKQVQNDQIILAKL